MNEAPAHRQPIAVEAARDGLKDRYVRLALVTHERHLAQLDRGDTDTLIVSSDWLLWQKAAAEGWHCIPAEWGILAWQGSDTLHTDLRIRANEWVYVDGRDATLFRGASLGKQFVTVRVLAAGVRMERALSALIETFCPKELVFFDFRAESNTLDAESRRFIALTVADGQGVTVRDRSDPVDANDPGLPMVAEDFNAPTEGSGSGLSRRALVMVFGGIFHAYSRVVHGLSRRRRNVLIMLNTSLSVPLMESYAGGAVRPVLLSANQSKKPSFVWSCIKKGALLIATLPCRLTATEKKAVRDIIATLEGAWMKPAPLVEELARRYARKCFLNEDTLFALAREVKKAERVLRVFSPSRLVVDGVKNPPYRTYVELAHENGIPVDYIWHSPYVPERLKVDALGGDPRCPPLVSRQLSWGNTNDEWLNAIGAVCQRVRVGYPLGEAYRRASPPPPTGKVGRVLVIEHSALGLDLGAVNATKYSYFVTVMRLLKTKGDKDAIFKVHPGPPRKEYYDAIAAYFGIDCEIIKYRPLRELLPAAEFVIGPVHSGAMAEALAADKRYFGFWIPPTSMDPGYYRHLDVLTDLAQLGPALEEGRSVSGDRALNDLCARDEIPNPCQRFWEVMEEGLPGDLAAGEGAHGGEGQTSPSGLVGSSAS
ncbi:MAG: hypothetical protein QGI13_00810 [Rhodospirillales bacterium]|nr:hypothetical protein [Rhodospirillales bacterium]